LGANLKKDDIRAAKNLLEYIAVHGGLDLVTVDITERDPS